MMLLSWCLLNLFIFAGDVLPMLSNRTITQRFSLVLRFESLTFYLLFQQWIFLQWSVFYACTVYLLCQGQGVLPLNSNRTTKQRFTIVLRHKFLILDLKQIVFAVFYDVRVQFLLTLTEFYFYQAQRVCSQWTQTGKPTNDFSMLLQLEPSTISWSIQRIYLYLGWSNVYNIHSLIHCCSTVELIIFVKNKSKTNPTFPTSVHWFFVSYLMCYQEAFNVETVHVKIYMIS